MKRGSWGFRTTNNSEDPGQPRNQQLITCIVPGNDGERYSRRRLYRRGDDNITDDNRQYPDDMEGIGTADAAPQRMIITRRPSSAASSAINDGATLGVLWTVTMHRSYPDPTGSRTPPVRARTPTLDAVEKDNTIKMMRRRNEEQRQRMQESEEIATTGTAASSGSSVA